MKRKKRRIVWIAIIALLFLLAVLLFLPVKFAVRIESLPDNKGHFFILEQQAVTGPNWKIVGDSNGTFSENSNVSVLITGIDPQEKLNNSLQVDSPNRYIVYGEITTEDSFYGEVYPVITSSGFDVIFPIERGNSLRFFVPKSYLTLLDYNWRLSK